MQHWPSWAKSVPSSHPFKPWKVPSLEYFQSSQTDMESFWKCTGHFLVNPVAVGLITVLCCCWGLVPMGVGSPSGFGVWGGGCPSIIGIFMQFDVKRDHAVCIGYQKTQSKSLCSCFWEVNQNWQWLKAHHANFLLRSSRCRGWLKKTNKK